MTHGGRTLSYGELWEQILALSGAYRALDIRPGDRVVCQLPTSPEHIIAAGAAWACGAIHVGAHKDLTGPELAAWSDARRPPSSCSLSLIHISEPTRPY